jgi:hypothetical protein
MREKGLPGMGFSIAATLLAEEPEFDTMSHEP